MRALVGGCIGHMSEWYDFAVYAYMAVILAPQFFPSDDPVASLMATFAVYGVGYVMRPIGAIVFGHLGDKLGRRRILAATIILMAISTFAIGLLPTYASIGVAAPILLCILRLIQGLSAGGEFAGGVSFVVEYADPRRRGFSAVSPLPPMPSAFCSGRWSGWA